jgi:hypothetical protein
MADVASAATPSIVDLHRGRDGLWLQISKRRASEKA